MSFGGWLLMRFYQLATKLGRGNASKCEWCGESCYWLLNQETLAEEWTLSTLSCITYDEVMQITMKFWILCTTFSCLDYIGNIVDPPNWYQTLGLKIHIKKRVFYCKNNSVVWLSNSERDLRISNYKTFHFIEKANEVSSFDERIKDYLPAESWDS